MISLSVGALYLCYLFLPGYLLCRSLGIRRHRFLLSFSLSLLTVSLSLLVGYAISSSGLVAVYALHALIFTLLVITLKVQPLTATSFSLIYSRFSPNRHSLFFTFWVLVASFSAYHLIVGPYSEIPSDIWKHLVRVQLELEQLQIGSPAKGENTSMAERLTVNPIYLMHAIFCYIFKKEPIELISAVTFATGSLFLATNYFFSFYILGIFRTSYRIRVFGASLATVLAFVSLGTATFSYARYYAYFPSIFAYPLVFAAIAITLDFLSRPSNKGGTLLLLPFISLLAALIHLQEALFIGISISLISAVRLARIKLGMLRPPRELDRRVQIFFNGSVFVVALVVVYALSARSISAWNTSPHVLNLGHFFRLLDGIPIDHPGFRLWDTVGYFGLLVFLGWAMGFRNLSRSDYLTAGMLMPLFTNLNPLYAITFLHFGSASGLWRTAYLIPLGLTASAICIIGLARFHEQTLQRKASSILLAVLMTISLLPWTIETYFNRTSRIPSLMPVAQHSGAGLWGDLIKKIDEIQEDRKIRRILTDSVTKFILYSATRGEMWWWTDLEYFPKHREIFESDILNSDYSHSLLVINRRNGSKTLSAEYSGHWPPDILNVSSAYPSRIDSFLRENEDLFSLLWDNQGIQIYLIQSGSG